MHNIKCPVCDNDFGLPFLKNLRDRVHPSKKTFNFIKCSVCGLVRQHPMPEEEELTEYYKDYPYDQPALKEQYRIGIRDRIIKCFYKSDGDILESAFLFLPYLKFKLYDKYQLWHIDTFYRNVFKRRGDLLDVGCGHGSGIFRWKKMGFNVLGIDIDERSLEFARKNYGVDVRYGDLFDFKFADATFDVITMCHSFEHLPDPIKTLKELNKILKDGGELVIWVPNIDSVLFKIVKNDWHGLETPRHLYHYNAAALSKLLALAGFSVRKILYEPYKFGYKNSVKYFGKSKNLPDWLIGFLKNLATPVTFLSYIFRKGDNVIVCAVKKL